MVTRKDSVEQLARGGITISALETPKLDEPDPISLLNANRIRFRVAG